jgi:hypothetical protein
MAIVGAIFGAFNLQSVFPFLALFLTAAVQMWINPEVFIPRFVRESARYRRRIFLEYILTCQAGVIILMVAFYIVQGLRQVIPH